MQPATGEERSVRLALVLVLAFAVRSLGVEQVFVGGDDVVLWLDDSQYHARRALFTLANFPRTLSWDAYLNYPAGAWVPWPPLYDLALASVARVLGGEPAILDRVLAWSTAVLATTTTLLVYAVARAVTRPTVALGAAAIYAVLPATTTYSSVGNADHHAAIACLGTALLALYLAAVRTGIRGARLALVHACLVLARAGILLVWHGSLLYLGIGELALVGVLALSGRRDGLAAQALSAPLAAIFVVPALTASDASVGGAWTTIALSNLHVVALCADGAIAGVLALLAWLRPEPRWSLRGLRLAGVSLAAAVVLLATLPGLREGLALAQAYLAKEEKWIAYNYESQPIFHWGSAATARMLYGFLGFLLPLTPLAALARARERSVREPAILLAIWTAAFAFLGSMQIRYNNDFAPAGSVCFALLLEQAGSWVRGRMRLPPQLAAALPAAAGLALLAPVLAAHAARAPRTFAYLRGTIEPGDRALETVHGTAHRFAQQLRAATPETSGFLTPEERPQYGVLCFPIVGLVFQNMGRRPTTADNFGPYLGGENFLSTMEFFLQDGEEKALATAQRLGARYVVTAEQAGRVPRTAALHRLHIEDGTAQPGLPPFERFRLVTEGPRGGRPIGLLEDVRFQSPVPYKLFEIVEGAMLEVHVEPGAAVTAEVRVVTPFGRRFAYRARALAGSNGTARLRVPYATDTSAPVRPLGPWRVRVGETVREVGVTDADVLKGATVLVEAASGVDGDAPPVRAERR